jgi:hypothetical protein
MMILEFFQCYFDNPLNSPSTENTNRRKERGFREDLMLFLVMTS